jgi:predicted Zn-dependent protease with MMP-like domain
MDEWLRKARAAGLTPDEIEAIYRTALRDSFAEEDTA